MRDIRGGRIAMIFQEPMTSLSPLHTIGDQIAEAARIHRQADGRQSRDMALDLLAKVGFQHPQQQLDAYPFELSGGMRQRAMIAMALMCQPAILIADEPTTALDVTTQANILSLMKGLQSQFDMGILLITHDLGVVANVADDVAVMYRGEMMERGNVEAIFRDARHPYLKALMRCVPKVDGTPEDRLTPLRDAVPSEPQAGHRKTLGQSRHEGARGSRRVEDLLQARRAVLGRLARRRVDQGKPLGRARRDARHRRRVGLGQDHALQDHHGGDEAR